MSIGFGKQTKLAKISNKNYSASRTAAGSFRKTQAGKPPSNSPHIGKKVRNLLLAVYDISDVYFVWHNARDVGLQPFASVHDESRIIT